MKDKLVYLNGTKLFAYNDVQIGEVLAKEDGFYDWWPDQTKCGFMPAYMLKAIADLLDEKNESLQKELDEFFYNEFSSKAINMLIPFFETKEKAEGWLYIKNPNFGYISPIKMYDLGKGEKVLDFINEAKELWDL